jgi:hypothetical protein
MKLHSRVLPRKIKSCEVQVAVVTPEYYVVKCHVSAIASCRIMSHSAPFANELQFVFRFLNMFFLLDSPFKGKDLDFTMGVRFAQGGGGGGVKIFFFSKAYKPITMLNRHLISLLKSIQTNTKATSYLLDSAGPFLRNKACETWPSICTQC